MIASLTGTILSCSAGQVVLDVQGVGYLIHCTSSALVGAVEGQRASFHTSLVVREDAFTLFGFPEKAELEVFELLRSVNGVGPKSALSILNQLSVEQISRAVNEEADAAFRAVSGIGAKTSKLIILTLAGKLVSPSARVELPATSDQTVAALVGLGWSERQAREAVQDIDSTGLTEKEILRAALSSLSKARRA